MGRPPAPERPCIVLCRLRRPVLFNETATMPLHPGRTVQELDRGVDGRSCITLLTESSSSTSHRAAGGTGRDHGVAVPSTAAGSGDCRAPGDSVRGGSARRTRGRRAALVHDSKLTVNDPNPEASHRPILYDSGRPSSVIWFRTLHATTDSATRPPRDRARSRSPRIDLYRKNAFSTRAWRW